MPAWLVAAQASRENTRNDCRGVEGVVLTLSDTSQIACIYMGTDPALPSIPNTTLSDSDYHVRTERAACRTAQGIDVCMQAIDEESRQLQAVIRGALLGGAIAHTLVQSSVRTPG